MRHPAGILAAASCLLLPLPAQAPPARSMAGNHAAVPAIRQPDAEVEAAVERGLAWLARQQNEHGFWHGVVGVRGGRDSYTPIASLELQIAAGSGHLGVTALSGMAFLAGGHLPGRGAYGVNVHAAMEAVLSCVQENGVISASGTRMYSHAFATLFLAELYGNVVDARLKTGLERATHIIVDCQNEHGGWRYNAFARDSDLSVTVCQLQALRAARNIGIHIPKSTIDRAVEYVALHQITSGPAKGLYYYDIYGPRAFRKSDHYSIQAAAATSLLSAGIYDHDRLDSVIDFLERDLPGVMRHTPHHYCFWYGNYYASQVFHQADGLLRAGCFDRYYAAMRAHLLADQQPDGRWLNPPEEGPGDAFGTAVACIILQIPKQYLPIFQR
ncbi:MAG TPA: prenyltransferase/squalene oxidase repeat-containing protein [Planctomycetota bacterium]|nr:prenyltransferase/squalene oxidase repeat-containing protein [Planctomycetota bacterium]